MTRLPRTILLVACGGSLAASAAWGAVPSPADSDLPCGINLVGITGGAPDARGTFTVVVRDLGHNAIAGSSVVLDFNNCLPDIRLCKIQPDPDVSGIAACDAPVVQFYAVTDGSGSVTLSLVGGAKNTASGTPGAGYKCATFYADGINLGTVNVGAFDENGAGGVNPADISVWLSDSFNVNNIGFVGRSDFNCTNSINPADLSLLLAASLGAGSFTSCTEANYCN